MKSIEPFRLLQDGVVYVCCVTPIVVLRVFAEPRHRGFFCDDESIRYPNLPSTISTVALILVGVIVPLAIILGVEAYRFYKIEPELYECTRTLNSSTVTVDVSPLVVPIGQGVYLFDRLIHPLLIRFVTYASAFLFGASICETLTDVAKITVGELRPHFLEACQPDWTRINCSNHRYIDDFVCLNPDRGHVREARQSFPSGHASFSAYCACFAVLYLRHRASWPLSAGTGRLVRPLMQYALILTAFGTGLTRIADNQHHAMDVAFGFVLGIVIALAVCYHFQISGSPRRSDEDYRDYKRMKTNGAARGHPDKESTGLLYQE